jgi:hypothetical protein
VILDYAEYIVFGQDIALYVILCARGPSEAIAECRESRTHRLNALENNPARLNHSTCTGTRCSVSQTIPYSSRHASDVRNAISRAILASMPISRDSDQE